MVDAGTLGRTIQAQLPAPLPPTPPENSMSSIDDNTEGLAKNSAPGILVVTGALTHAPCIPYGVVFSLDEVVTFLCPRLFETH